MNKRRLIIIIPAAALLLLTACTQDEPGGKGNELPYGEYPLQIGGVTLDVESSAEPWSTKAPQTRVTEDNTDGMSSVWEWDGSETIRVQLGDETADYTLNAGEELTPDRQLYWTSTDPATVTAWYPTDETIDPQLHPPTCQGACSAQRHASSGGEHGGSLRLHHLHEQ